MSFLVKILVGASLVIAAIFLFAALAAIPVYFLWNWLCPQLFGLPVITFWQAAGLSALCGCLFKSNNISKKEN